MIKKASFIFLLIFLLSASTAFPWGGIESVAPTHQLILKKAYNLLKQDPAFKGGEGLPVDLQQILVHEGVRAAVANGKPVMIPGIGYMPLGFDKAVGPGPDATGASRYSLHYYNPATNKGRAPKAVQYYYKRLLDPDKLDKAKGSAWSAHFLADMSVPYHVVGMPGSLAKATLQEAESKNKPVKLSQAVTGPLSLYRNGGKGFSLLGYDIIDPPDKPPPDGWGGNKDFTKATKHYIDKHYSSVENEWFDPWYSNGAGDDVLASSHVVWEYLAHKTSSSIIPPSEYNNEDWNNHEAGSFKKDAIIEKQAEKSLEFTIAAANHTRKIIKKIHTNPVIGIENAIQNVATLWRASFSALRPEIIVEPASAEQPNMCRFKCRVKNLAREMAGNGKVKIYISQGQKSVHTKIKSIGKIESGTTKVAEFMLPLEPDNDYDIKMVVIAEYEKTPDLQYATAETTYHSNPETTEPSGQENDTKSDTPPVPTPPQNKDDQDPPDDASTDENGTSDDYTLGPFTGDVIVQGIRMSPAATSITIAQTATIKAIPLGMDGKPLPAHLEKDLSYEWLIDDPSLANIHGTGSTGTVSGIKPGIVKAWVLAGGSQGGATITITGCPENSVLLTENASGQNHCITCDTLYDDFTAALPGNIPEASYLIELADECGWIGAGYQQLAEAMCEETMPGSVPQGEDCACPPGVSVKLSSNNSGQNQCVSCEVLQGDFDASVTGGDLGYAQSLLDLATNCGWTADGQENLNQAQPCPENTVKLSGNNGQNQCVPCDILFGDFNAALGQGDIGYAETLVTLADSCGWASSAMQQLNNSNQQADLDQRCQEQVLFSHAVISGDQYRCVCNDGRLIVNNSSGSACQSCEQVRGMINAALQRNDINGARGLLGGAQSCGWYNEAVQVVANVDRNNQQKQGQDFQDLMHGIEGLTGQLIGEYNKNKKKDRQPPALPPRTQKPPTKKAPPSRKPPQTQSSDGCAGGRCCSGHQLYCKRGGTEYSYPRTSLDRNTDWICDICRRPFKTKQGRLAPGLRGAQRGDVSCRY